jgi:hypothetical protein
LSHADVVSLGRVGTAFFLEEYGNMLGRNKRAVIQKTVGEIHESGVMPFLPAELRERVEMQADTIGPDTLLTSGRISVLGLATRDALQKRHAMMFMQRPRDNRPAIEDGISFPAQSSHKGIPLSDSSIGGQIVDDLTNRVYEIAGPARRRDVAGTAGSIANIIGGMGLTEIGSAVGGSLITVGRAVVPATIDAVRDFGLRRQLNR